MNALDDVAVLLLLLGMPMLLAGAMGLFRYGHGLGERIYRINRWMRKAGLVVTPVALVLLLLTWLINGQVDVS